jgi:hypothetical protein
MGCHCLTIGPCPSFCHAFRCSPRPSSHPFLRSSLCFPFPLPSYQLRTSGSPESPTHLLSQTPNQLVSLYPLQEVAGAEGIMRVHVPFSLTDLSQIKKKNASVPSPLTLTLILKNFNIWPNLTASPGMTFIPSSPQSSSWRRDEGSRTWLRHTHMRFTAPPLPTCGNIGGSRDKTPLGLSN